MSKKLKYVPLDLFKLQLHSHIYDMKKGFDQLICENSLSFEPKPWQVNAAIRSLRDMHGSCLLADEVGLGKTIEAGLIIKELFERNMIKRVLILVPAPLVEQWKVEMQEKFSLDFFDVRNDNWEDKPLIISSLPLAVRSNEKRESLQKLEYDLVVVDEAHSLKNHRTTSYKFVYSLKRKHTLLMSATPIQNDLRELFNLINIIKPGYFKSRKQFRRDYMENRFTPKNVKKLKQLLAQVMIRNRRSNTLVELPNRNVLSEYVELTKEERVFYNNVLRFCQDIYKHYIKGQIQIGWDQTNVNIFTLMLFSLLKQNASSPASVVQTLKEKMMPRLEESYERTICRDLIAEGEKIIIPSKAKKVLNMINDLDESMIIYSEYIPTLNLLEKYFLDHGISVIKYHGGLNQKEKHEAVQDFKAGKAKIFLSTESGGQGINLQFCRRIINYDLPWNPMRIEQRIGRVHRFGQKQEVFIHMLPAKGTIDEYLLFILTSKIKLFELVIGELDAIMSYMLNGDTSFDVHVGKIILESKTPEEMEKNLRMIGERLLLAKEEYSKHTVENNQILDEIGVDKDE